VKTMSGSLVEGSGEPCLSGKLLIQLGESFSGKSKIFTGRDLVTGTISLVKL
jgi:hypothetical protein